MPEALLDTDIVNEVLKQKNANGIQKASEYLRQHEHFLFSSLTRGAKIVSPASADCGRIGT